MHTPYVLPVQMVALLDFQFPLSWRNILCTAIELSVPRNILFAFETTFLSRLKGKIHVLPIRMVAILDFPLPPTWRNILYVAIELSVAGNILFSFEITFLSRLRAKIHVLPVWIVAILNFSNSGITMESYYCHHVTILHLIGDSHESSVLMFHKR